jgi:tetratricopeptide (TPR) repeat protein
MTAAAGPMMGPPTVAAALAAARQGDLQEAARLASGVILEEQTPEQAMMLTHLRGGIAFELGQLDEAEICFEQVISFATEQRNPILIAKASNNLGSIAHLRGKVELATSFYRSALQAYTIGEDEAGMAQTGHNLSIVLKEFGDLKAAAALSQRAIESARRTNDMALQALVFNGAAEISLLQGELERARELLFHAGRLADLAGDRISALETRRLRARVDFRRGQLATALRDASKVYLASQRMGAVHLSGECALLAAEVARSLHRSRLADRYRQRAQAAYRQLGSPARAEMAGHTQD